MTSHAERIAAFTAALRDPAKPTPTHLPPARIKTYRSLALNNLERLFAESFPLCAALIGAKDWRTLVEAFFRDWRPRTHGFPELPAELVAYLAAGGQPGLPPWLPELAAFEWLSLEVRQDLRELPDQGPLSAAELDACPQINPLLRLRQFLFPVHEFTVSNQAPAREEPVFLATCRGRDDEPRFMALNPATARLLELLVRNPGCSGREVLMQIAQELWAEQPDDVLAAGAMILKRLEAEEMVLGAVGS